MSGGLNRRSSLSSYAKTARFARWLRRTSFVNRSPDAACQPEPRAKRALAKVGGEGGIRTHVPFRTRRFRGAPVTTTSVPLPRRDPCEADLTLYPSNRPGPPVL